jgi:hypothetical protein
MDLWNLKGANFKGMCLEKYEMHVNDMLIPRSVKFGMLRSFYLNLTF